MTPAGHAPHQRPPAEPWWFAPLLIWCIVAFATGGAAAISEIADEGGVDHPSEWDPRVDELASYVEQERDLDFAHPVHVDFLDARAYSEATRGEVAESTDADLEASRRDVARLRAMGLLGGDVDLDDAVDEVADEGTLAFYSTVDDRIRVRGTEMTVDLRVTLVHELTHALQDQHFDLDRIDEFEQAGSSFGFRALAEGDAIRIEEAYIDEELTERERARVRATEEGETGAPAEEALEGVPDGLIALFSAPYALGPPLVAAIAVRGGNDEVNRAFRDPPTTDEHLFDLLTYLDHEGSVDVGRLEPGAGEEVFDEGELGAVGWYLLLASHNNPFETLEAADGWGGDAYVAYVTADDTVCLRARFVGDSDDDSDEMAEALGLWRDRMPGDQEVQRVSGGVELETCDPGPDAAGPENSPLDVLSVPSLRGYLMADALTVLDAAGARCYAGRVLDGLTLDQIADPDGTVFQSAEFQQRIERAFRACQRTR